MLKDCINRSFKNQSDFCACDPSMDYTLVVSNGDWSATFLLSHKHDNTHDYALRG